MENTALKLDIQSQLTQLQASVAQALAIDGVQLSRAKSELSSCALPKIQREAHGLVEQCNEKMAEIWRKYRSSYQPNLTVGQQMAANAEQLGQIISQIDQVNTEIAAQQVPSWAGNAGQSYRQAASGQQVAAAELSVQLRNIAQIYRQISQIHLGIFALLAADIAQAKSIIDQQNQPDNYTGHNIGQTIATPVLMARVAKAIGALGWLLEQMNAQLNPKASWRVGLHNECQLVKRQLCQLGALKESGDWPGISANQLKVSAKAADQNQLNLIPQTTDSWLSYAPSPITP